MEKWNSLQRELAGQSNTTTLSDGDLIDNNVFFRIVPDNADNVSADYNYAGYLYFDKLNVLQDPTKAIYGVFSVSSVTATINTPPYYDELLFRITNSSNEYFEAVINATRNSEGITNPLTRFKIVCLIFILLLELAIRYLNK